MYSAHYATNVHHYDHVLEAMSGLFSPLYLQRRTEVTRAQLRRIESVPFLAPVASILRRRSRDESIYPDEIGTLGISQLVFPLLGRIRVKPTLNHYQWVTRSAASKVASASATADVLQFVEGLGHRALARNEYRLTICERRNFHHAVYEQPIETFGGFPNTVRRDPIGEILDYEYHHSDYILVYSDAARSSFLDRGFSPEKVISSPIGLGAQLPLLPMARDQFKIAYVGRGDAYKGLDVAVEAVKLMGSPYRLTVAGSMAPDVVDWMKQHSHVDYLGNLSRLELRELYSTTSCVVSPSVESFGLAILEAVSHGAPLITRETTGARQYLPESLVTTVVGRDPDTWANEIRIMVEGETLTAEDRRVLGRRAVEKVSWEQAAIALRGAYQQMEIRH